MRTVAWLVAALTLIAAGVYTVVSLARSYVLRRVFEHRRKESPYRTSEVD